MGEGRERGVRVKGLHIVTAKGRTYVYAYRGGPCIWKGAGKPKLSAQDVARLTAALGDQERASRGSFGGWLRDWQASAEWARMAESTRREWAKTTKLFPSKWNGLGADFWQDQRATGRLMDWRSQWAATPRKADYAIQVLAALFSWCETTGRMKRGTNPAKHVPKLWKGGQHAEVIWTREEVERMQAAPQPLRDAFNLARLTGLRRGDLVNLPRSACGETAILWKTGKSGRIVRIPYTPALRALVGALAARGAEAHDGQPKAAACARRAGDSRAETLLVNASGRSWTPGALNTQFNRWRDKLGLPPKRLHDCRGTYVTELRKAGLGAKEIALQVGWSGSRVGRLLAMYSDETSVVVAMGERMSG